MTPAHTGVGPSDTELFTGGLACATVQACRRIVSDSQAICMMTILPLSLVGPVLFAGCQVAFQSRQLDNEMKASVYQQMIASCFCCTSKETCGSYLLMLSHVTRLALRHREMAGICTWRAEAFNETTTAVFAGSNKFVPW